MNDENKNLNTPSDDDDGLNGLFDLFERLRSEHGGALPFGPGGDDDDDDDDGEYSNMDASDFHNLSCRYAPHNKTKAISVCRAGLERYPNDMDLLADIVKYATENGDLATAEIYYGKLMTEVPMKRFNWRAFTFAFDYLIHHVNQREDECRALVEAYKSHLPHEEKAAMSESELESALGNHEQSMAVLKDAISRLPNAPSAPCVWLTARWSWVRWMR